MFSFSSSLQDKPTIQAVLCQTNKRRRDLDYLARSFFSLFLARSFFSRWSVPYLRKPEPERRAASASKEFSFQGRGRNVFVL